MSTSPIPITLLGSTGLTGNATLHTLLMSPKQAFSITTFSRSAPKVPIAISKQTTHNSRTFADLADAVNEQVGTPGGVYATCLGTTRAQAGGFEQQRKIDLELNRDLARKAKADGCTTGILLSSGMGNSSSYAPYLKMKGELEDAFKDLGFEHTVILKPGLLMGERNEVRTAEWATQKLFRGMGAIGLPMKSLMIEAHEVGECIAYFTANPPKEQLLVLGNNDMIAYAKKRQEMQ